MYAIERFILSLSVIFPAIAGVFKLKEIDKINRFFFICIFLGLLTEVVVFFVHNLTILNYYIPGILTKNIIANVYVLLEFCLLFYQLQKWGLLMGSTKLRIVYFLVFIFWIVTSFVINDIGIRNVYFRILYSVLIVLGAIQVMSKIVFERKQIIRDHRFIICVCFIVFYTYNILVESFVISHLKLSEIYRNKIFDIKCYINFAVNIMYSIAILCIPKKKTFIVQL